MILLKRYIVDMMHRRRNAEEREERYDLLSSLLDASEEAEGKSKLTDQELVGGFLRLSMCWNEKVEIFPPGFRKYLRIPYCWYVISMWKQHLC